MKSHRVIPENETTREKILRVAEQEIYLHGYQGFRIDALLKNAQIAKGALYHYFPTKLDIGYAVVDEVITGYFLDFWKTAGEQAQGDVLQGIQSFLRDREQEFSDGECTNGCGLSNLIQEMSMIDEGFNQRLRQVVELVIRTVADAITLAQQFGEIKPSVKPLATAHFILASYQGIMGVAKCMQNAELVNGLFNSLCEYVESLRADLM